MRYPRQGLLGGGVNHLKRLSGPRRGELVVDEEPVLAPDLDVVRGFRSGGVLPGSAGAGREAPGGGSGPALLLGRGASLAPPGGRQDRLIIALGTRQDPEPMASDGTFSDVHGGSLTAATRVRRAQTSTLRSLDSGRELFSVSYCIAPKN